MGTWRKNVGWAGGGVVGCVVMRGHGFVLPD